MEVLLLPEAGSPKFQVYEVAPDDVLLKVADSELRQAVWVKRAKVLQDGLIVMVLHVYLLQLPVVVVRVASTQIVCVPTDSI